MDPRWGEVDSGIMRFYAFLGCNLSLFFRKGVGLIDEEVAGKVGEGHGEYEWFRPLAIKPMNVGLRNSS